MVAVSLSKIALALAAITLSPLALAKDDPFVAHNSPKEDLRKKIFPSSLTKLDCKVVVRRLTDELNEVDKSIKDFVDGILKGLRTKDSSALKGMFHPRLKVTNAKSEEIFATLGSAVVEPWEFSIYRMWAFNVPSDQAATKIDCAPDDLKVSVHSGYPLQFAMWLQVMGKNELARIFVSVVPDPKGQWRIGAWHFQQWTHLGKDPEAWTQLAIKDQKAGLNLPAYLKYDIASKLIDSSYFVDSKLKQQILDARAQVGSRDQMLVDMQKKYKDSPITFVDSVLAEDGPGILFRLVVKGDESAVQMADMCRKLGKEFYTDPINRQHLGGIRCSYSYPGEPPTREGKLGGRFFPKKEFL